MSVGVRASCKQDARCCVSTAQHSIDESGQMSWQGELDIPISYGTFSECSAPRHAPGFLLAPDKKTHTNAQTHTREASRVHLADNRSAVIGLQTARVVIFHLFISFQFSGFREPKYFPLVVLK